uniref:Putative secreted protein n=1 Tax=Anopheles triannulatus TaxID=58253 RepID=A0A2M4B595_9DIPT
MGRPFSLPLVHSSIASVFFMSMTFTAPGAPGGPWIRTCDLDTIRFTDDLAIHSYSPPSTSVRLCTSKLL